jgi:hypothetical protein
LETEERLCKLCITLKIEDEYHFLIDCPIYNNSRKICHQKISELCPNFNNMSDKTKFYYLIACLTLKSLRNVYFSLIKCSLNVKYVRTFPFLSSFIHFFKYNNSRKICHQKISELCPNFNNMSDKTKFYYLFTKEDLSIINKS